ncbi:murein L,D-transpeptidase catalytic domain family protein [Segetibacter koreensis]|uniref:murein L,D-transpeptidase catalytic domain family protein n=1 Tax=Segetibacter koreensis TaxID=398037 RepID=UPI000366A2B6|nr:murein L,D-transpeptidase catalytic domain family protein [Segetibacter koreensis]
MRGFSKLAGKVLLVTLLFISVQSFAGDNKKGLPGGDKNFPTLLSNSASAPVIKRISDSIYDLISLGEYGLEKDVFFNAYKGFQYLESKGMLNKTNVLTICDYSQSSRNKRLYVIDVVNSRLLFNTYVSHGKNSGEEFATSFSNLYNSNKSSLGFLVTGQPYKGKAGLSLQLNGMEPGINDRVKMRSIVLHGSKYVAASVAGAKGAISRSYGCPAVPYGIHFRIIDAIKGGSCVFVSYPDDWYTHTSAILNAGFDLNPSYQINDPSSIQNNTASNTDGGSLYSTDVK